MADSNEIDYAVVLADLKAKRDRIDAAIAGIETMLGMQTAVTWSAAPPASLLADLGPGAFLGMKVVEAVVRLLTSRRQAMRTDEIVSELKRGGVAFATDSPINTVGSMLNREFKNGGDIVSVGRGQWALAEWHPRLRKRRPQNQTLDDVVGEGVDDAVTSTDAPAVALKIQPLKITVPDLDDEIPF